MKELRIFEKDEIVTKNNITYFKSTNSDLPEEHILSADDPIRPYNSTVKNLDENILPTRNRASMIVKKNENHKIEELWLRKR